MSWKIAPSVRALIVEVDRRWPSRSRASDGTIGDQAHAARRSHHNPSNPGRWVDAVDITHDPDGGPDARIIADAAAGDPRVHHVIYGGRIWSARSQRWRTYSGANPHTGHVHVAVSRFGAGSARDRAARDDVSPWLTREDPDDMTDDDRRKLHEIHAALYGPDEDNAGEDFSRVRDMIQVIHGMANPERGWLRPALARLARRSG